MDTNIIFLPIIACLQVMVLLSLCSVTGPLELCTRVLHSCIDNSKVQLPLCYSMLLYIREMIIRHVSYLKL